MKNGILKYLKAENIISLVGKNKKDVLEEIISFASSHGKLEKQLLEQAVWKREELMSTGLSHGLALPHVRLAGLEEPSIVMGICTEPLKDYASIDNVPIRMVILIIASDHDQDVYLGLLRSVSSKIKKDSIVRDLAKMRGEPEKVLAFLAGIE